MNKIVKKIKISDKIFKMTVEAPLIAEERKAGQFIILSLDNDIAERIPLTIAGADIQSETIDIIFQIAGKTTKVLAQLEEGDYIANIVGPLGQPTEIKNYGHAVCVCGGIGGAPMLPIAQALKEAGNKVTVILGARSKELIVLENELRQYADEFILCTDDGSAGRKALVTEPLLELCKSADNAPDMVMTIGPPLMMKYSAETTRPFKIKTYASLNTIMIDGTGMCGGCRVTVGGENKFVCVDGPEFDAHLVDFDNMTKRLNSFKDRERQVDHHCNLDQEIAYLRSIQKDTSN
ncbi:sulfide/dihydroorotate dehydrogenase-like FAD/NAD-binding protein [Lentisphaerota bacterium WC36G]|nr:sulfide/dihydroorotate dehydrogenase-like FAD/NAD-binding protein [Lentisphaerae bacterium WC36]